MRMNKLPAFPADLGVTDERDSGNAKAAKTQSVALADRRGKVKRRRLIDPATCQRLYTPDDIQFMKAMDQYKRDNRRPFPTWSEVLEVLHALGYRRVAEATRMPGVSAELPPKLQT